MPIIALAARSIMGRRRQYFPLFLVCAVCSGVSFFALFLSNGMSEAFRDKARIYYGGDFQLLGGRTSIQIDDTEGTLALIKPLLPPGALIASRIAAGGKANSLFYEGEEVPLRVIMGVDFEVEQGLFSRFTYASADCEAARNPASLAGSRGILLSERTAARLGAREGDSVTLFCRTVQGYLNSVDFRVAGVFLDSSVLGLYTAYCDVEALRAAMGMPANVSTRISFIFPQPPSSKDIAGFQASFSCVLNMYPLVSDKKLFYDDVLYRRLFKDAPAYAIITLDANQEDVEELSAAMNAVFAAIIFMLSLIIIAGVASAYRVIVLKRVSEIGVYMSIGMRSRRIAALLFLETMLILAGGTACGLLLCGILCRAARLIDLTSIPGIDIFLNQGVLAPLPTLAGPALFCLGVFVTTGLAVLFTIKRAVAISPVEAIRAI